MYRQQGIISRIACATHALLAATLMISAQETFRPPKSYDCYRAAKPIKIDGKLNEQDWKKALWTEDFVDIEGATRPTPRFRTRAKLLWDDNYLYVAAELQEPDVKATLIRHDSVIFRDNDFEVFIKPSPLHEGYFEFELNALNTGWDLYLNKPYREGGKADNSWEIPGLKTAVVINGTLNDTARRDKGWTIELAFPWTAFASRLPIAKPAADSEWRVNFSRVEWTTGQTREDNWVWSPQGVINMHVPDRWGTVHFR